MDIPEYLQNAGIDTVGTENEHVSEGWIGVDCPFCGEKNQYHLGISIGSGGCKCWRCGKHKLPETLKALGLSPKDFFSNVTLYGRTQQTVQKAETLTWPTGTSSGMWEKHKHYLRKRRFDPDYISRTWHVRSVGPTGKYCWRLVLPIFYGNEAVSWTTRDVTGKADTPYLTCPKAWEKRDIKHCLYGIEHTDKRVIAVEGPMDAWRMGPGTVALLGSAWTTVQAQLLAQYNSVFVMFDWSDPEAMESARDLVDTLDMAGTHAELIQPTGTEAGDPGDMQDDEVKAVRRDLGMNL